MRNILAILLVCLTASAGPGSANYYYQQPVASGGGGGGSLILDKLTATPVSAVSFSRQLRTAYAGSCLRVRRALDNAEQDIGFVSNNLDTNSLIVFATATSCFVTKCYDQQSTNDWVQSVAAKQPTIYTLGGGMQSGPKAGTYAAFFTSSQYMTNYAMVTAIPITVFWVVNGGTAPNGLSWIGGNSGVSGWSFFSTTPATLVLGATGNGPSSSIANNTWYAIKGLWNGATTSKMAINAGSDQTGGNYGVISFGTTGLNADGSGGNIANITCSEAIIFSVDASSDWTNYKSTATVGTTAYYGIP